MQKDVQDRPAPQYPIESVDNALRLLLMFRHTAELRLSDARDALGVGQSTAHRLMAMLVYRGFVTQNPVTRVYQVGSALVEIGLAAVSKMDLRGVARPVLEALAADVGETVHLGVLEDGDVRFLDAVESDLALRVAGRVGMSLPAYATSLGKALLAHLSQEELRALYPRESLTPVTNRTVTRRSELEEELIRVRERGYAVNQDESEVGVRSLGMAVDHAQRGVVAAVSIAAPKARLTNPKVERAAERLRAACEEIGSALA